MSIEVRGLSKRYGTQWAVNKVSFQAKRGEIVGFLGPNGAGKSTTMKILSGFIPATEGEAFICGKNCATDSIQTRTVTGYLPEHNPLYGYMFITEYLRFVARTYGINKNVGDKIEEVIGKTGLQKERHKKIGQLSKGYRQRVGLAQAIIHDPEVLILDEPTTGLDPNQLTEIRSLIRELGKEKTVLFSSHILQEVQSICDRLIIINDGEIVADNTLDNIDSLQSSSIFAVEFSSAVELQKLTEFLGDVEVHAVSATQFEIAAFEQDVRPLLFEYASKNGLHLLSIAKKSENIEDIFRDLTTKQA